MQRRRSNYSTSNLLSLIGFILVVAGALVIFVQINRPADETVVTGAVTPDVVAAATASGDEAADGAADAQPTLESYEAISEAQLLIPAAGINAPVIRVYLDGQSWDVSNLGMNVGHLQGTRWMNEGPGNIVLSGHVEMRDGRKGIFAEIGALTDGDVVILQYRGQEQRYQVVEIRNVDPNDLSPVYPTESDLLTLITCDAYDFFQDSYQERTIVVAERLS